VENTSMNLLKSLAAVSSMTMFSRVLGFARDAIVARIFGAGMATDAFFVAFKLPNLLRRIFAEGAFSQAFVPILAEYKSKQGEDATRVFVSYVSGLLTLVLAVVTVLGMLAAPWVITVTAPGFADSPDKFALTTQLLRITFPYILLISLASLAGAILNTWNRFSVPAFAPTFLNVSMIGFALFAAPYFHPPMLAMAWAVTVGGVLQLAYQLPHLKKNRHAGAAAYQPERRRCGAGRQTDGAGDPRRIRQPDLTDYQHHIRLFPRVRVGLLDVLRRSPDGVSLRRAGRGAGDYPAAFAVEKLCQRQS
jgi:murein biosynthesis integral membrane protein MurJ